jgi:hypothetical protein
VELHRRTCGAEIIDETQRLWRILNGEEQSGSGKVGLAVVIEELGDDIKRIASTIDGAASPRRSAMRSRLPSESGLGRDCAEDRGSHRDA